LQYVNGYNKSLLALFGLRLLRGELSHKHVKSDFELHVVLKVVAFVSILQLFLFDPVLVKELVVDLHLSHVHFLSVLIFILYAFKLFHDVDFLLFYEHLVLNGLVLVEVSDSREQSLVLFSDLFERFVHFVFVFRHVLLFGSTKLFFRATLGVESCVKSTINHERTGLLLSHNEFISDSVSRLKYSSALQFVIIF